MAVADSAEAFGAVEAEEDVELGQFGPGLEDVMFLSNAEVAVILKAEEDGAPNKKQTACVLWLMPHLPLGTLPCAPP